MSIITKGRLATSGTILSSAALVAVAIIGVNIEAQATEARDVAVQQVQEANDNLTAERANAAATQEEIRVQREKLDALKAQTASTEGFLQ